jgi:hypothetical protein
VYAGGVSAGASFALKLPGDMPGELSGLVSEVMGLDPVSHAGEFDVSGYGVGIIPAAAAACCRQRRWALVPGGLAPLLRL